MLLENDIKPYGYKLPDGYSQHSWIPRIKAKYPRIYQQLIEFNPILATIEQQLAEEIDHATAVN